MATGVVGEEWAIVWTGGSSGQLHEEIAKGSGITDLARAEDDLGIREGTPIFVRPDLTLDHHLIEFANRSQFRSYAQSTRDSYALDLRLLFSFLDRMGLDWREAEPDDLESYEHWRRRHAANPRRIGGAKWNRERAAIQLLYGWAHRRALLERDPSAGLTSPRDVRSQRVRWLTPRALREWQRVGLAGYRRDGLREPDWDGALSDRNVAMVDLLYASGLRIREAGSLSKLELPDRESPNLPSMSAGFVASACAKGGRRQFWLTASALSSVEAYVTTSRRAAVLQANAAGRYVNLSGQRLVRSYVKGTGVLMFTDREGQEGRVRLDAIGPEERTRYYLHGEHGLDPLALWLDAAGRPLHYKTWSANVFPAANRRCAGYGLSLYCTPHMCRHSFALRMLVALEYALSSRAGMTAEERRREDILLGSPFDLVRDLLGHASTATTRKHYLEPLAGLRVEHLLGSQEEDDLHRVIARIAERSPLVMDLTTAAEPS